MVCTREQEAAVANEKHYHSIITTCTKISLENRAFYNGLLEELGWGLHG